MSTGRAGLPTTSRPSVFGLPLDRGQARLHHHTRRYMSSPALCDGPKPDLNSQHPRDRPGRGRRCCCGVHYFAALPALVQVAVLLIRRYFCQLETLKLATSCKSATTPSPSSWRRWPGRNGAVLGSLQHIRESAGSAAPLRTGVRIGSHHARRSSAACLEGLIDSHRWPPRHPAIVMVYAGVASNSPSSGDPWSPGHPNGGASRGLGVGGNTRGNRDDAHACSDHCATPKGQHGREISRSGGKEGDRQRPTSGSHGFLPATG